MGLRSFVGEIKLNRLRKRLESQPLDFPGALAKPKHVLVCLPEGLRELTLLKQFLPQIQDIFPKARVTLLALPGVRVHDIYPRKGFQILSPSGDQETWSGLPKKDYIELLRKQGVDLILDMNLGTSRFTRGVLLHLPEALRIGRGNHLGQPYYNLEIKTKYLRDEHNIYRSILTMVQRLRQSALGTTPSTN